MSHRARKSSAQWQQIIKQQRSSGLSQRAYCQGNELNPVTFSNWKRRLGIDSSGNPKPEPWLELPLPAAKQSPGRNQGWDIELDLGNGICLRLNQMG